MNLFTYIKAASILFMVGSMWLVLIVNEWLAMLVAGLVDLTDRPKIKFKDSWTNSKLLVQDIMINVNFGGYFRTTISSEVGRLQQLLSETGTLVARFINFGFLKIMGQQNHCIASIEPNDKHTFNAKKMIIGYVIFMAVNAAKYYLLYLGIKAL